jgi:hypothetical protein
MGLDIRKYDGISIVIEVEVFNVNIHRSYRFLHFLKTIKNTLERRWYDRDTPCK